MRAKEIVQSRHIGSFAKYSEKSAEWLILKPVGTGSYLPIGQGATAAKAWKDAL